MAVGGFRSVALSWETPPATFNRIQRYQVRYVLGSQQYTPWATIPNSDYETTSHTLTGLADETHYTIQVRAVNSSGNGASAQQRVTTPALPVNAPSGFVVAPGIRKLNLSWTAAASTVAVERYQYRLSTDGGDTWNRDWTGITGSDATTTSHTVSGLANATDYAVELRIRAGTTRSPAATQSATTLDVPSAPVLTAMSGDRSITLTWTTPDNGGDAIRRYHYRRTRSSPGFTPWLNIPDSGPSTTHHTFSIKSGIQDEGRIFTFEVRAVNAVGNGRAGSVDGTTAVQSGDPTQPTIRVWTALAQEGRHAAVDFSVELNPAASSTVTVDYRTEDRTATAPEDYQATSGTLTFAPGETAKTVLVPIVDDAVEDSGESFWLRLSNVSGARLGVERATGLIYNEEDVVAGFTLVDAASGTDVGALADGTQVTLDDPATGQYGFRVETTPDAMIGSLGLELSGAKTATRTDNAAPYTLYADGGEGLPPGAYTLQATAYPDTDGAGTALQTRSVSFTVAAATEDAVDGASLSASFPASRFVSRLHTGASDRPQLVVAFSEAVAAFAANTPSVQVMGGTVSSVQAHTEDGLAHAWLFFLTPDGDGDMTFALATDAACASGGICTPGGTMLTQVPAARTIPGPEDAAAALSASFAAVPAAHDGSTPFTFALKFSEAPTMSYVVLRDDAFSVSGGEVRNAQRQQQGSNEDWTITVEPDSSSAVTIRLPATQDCSASGAICTADERPLSNSPSATVAGPNEEPAATNTAATGAPTISGTAQVNETLTASVSGISDADGLENASYAHQWVRGNTDIGGATDSAYTLASADEGETIQVRVSFTDDAGNAESLTSRATDAVAAAPEPLTASFSGMPSEHGGAGTTFTFRLQFSEAPAVSYTVLRDQAFDVTGGAVRKARRVDGRDDLREIEVEPSSNGTVSIRLPSAGSCSASDAICTSDGRPLANSSSATVAGPAGLSVADAEAEENTDPTIDFTVTLDRAASGTVTVDYATADGSATAGADYTAASGTLSFQPGERTKTIEVAVLDDTHDEGEERLTLSLSNAAGAVITDGEATGTIENHDPMPRALLARFGRVAATHVVEHVEERLQASREPGFRGRFAGRELRKGMERDIALSFLRRLGGSVGMNPAGGGAHGAMTGMPGGGAGMGMSASGTRGTGAASLGAAGLGGGPGIGMAGASPMRGGGIGPGSMQGGGRRDGMVNGGGLLRMGLGGGDILTGSAFALNRETKKGGILSLWSRGAQSSFHGREGVLSLNGDVRTTMFGADYAKGRMVAGLALARSMSIGGYSAEAAGQVESAVTGLYPWLGYQLTDRVSVWGVTGYGAGGLMLTPGEGTPLESGLSMAMAAGGTRGELVADGAGGFALAFKADALWVGTSIDGVDGPGGRLKATGAAVTRFRTGLEGSRDYPLGNVLSLKPLVEVGLRHDGGDAERGAGIDVGGGVMVSSPSTGLSADVRVRMLLVHQAEGFRERGMSVSLSYNPRASTPLGFMAKVAPSWGGQATSGAQALWGRETMAGLANGGVAAGNRLDGEVGYGLPLGSRFVGTPRVGLTTSEYGRAYRLGYGMTLLEKNELGVELGVDAQRRESPAAGGTDNGVLGRATVRW